MKKHLVKVFALAIGVFFIATGALKIFAWDAFALGMSNVFPDFSGVGLVLGVLVVISEIAGGGLVITKKYRKKGLLLLTGLCIAFILYLALLHFTGNEIPCSCFGLLEVQWSSQVHILFDTFLLICLLLFLLFEEIGSSGYHTKQKILGGIGVFSLALTIAAFIVQPETQKQIDLDALQIAVSTHFRNVEAPNFVLHFVDQADFYCGLCQQSFLFMSDSLSRSDHVYQLILLRENDQIHDNKTHAKIWKRQLNVSGEVSSDSMRLFDQVSAPKSSIFLFNEKRELVDWGTYPLESKIRKAILGVTK